MADVFVVMGVCGCGKTTVGRALAEATGGVFVEGDGFHPPVNVEKMRRGIPLGDADRAEWLAAMRERIAEEQNRAGPPAFVACSALKQSYRDVLAEAGPVFWLYLRGDERELRRRMQARKNHYMPASLLESQLAILEEPDEAIVVDIAEGSEAIVAR
ncbi:MAG: gluconokinase, partial [Phycisphaeraceae bacterium]|nr:gluconokinase [Phycisphaeraceae bacterium]